MLISIVIGWLPGSGLNRNMWKCKPCRGTKWLNVGTARRHEESASHKRAIEHELLKASQVASTSSAPPPPIGVAPQEVLGPLAHLLQDVSENITTSPLVPIEDPDGAPQSIDWDAVSAELGGELRPSAAKAALSDLTSSLHRWIVGGDDSDSTNSSPEPTEMPEEHEGVSELLQPPIERIGTQIPLVLIYVILTYYSF